MSRNEFDLLWDQAESRSFDDLWDEAEDQPKTELGTVARQFGRGVAESGLATGQGLMKMIPDAILPDGSSLRNEAVDERFGARREALGEWAGPADTLPEKAAGVVGRLAGEAGQFVASGMGVGAAARGLASVPGRVGQVASALAKPANLAQRVAQGAVADVPITTAQALAGAEESITGGLAEMTGSETLRQVAENPFTRVPADLAVSIGTGALADVGLDRAARALRRTPDVVPDVPTPEVTTDVAPEVVPRLTRGPIDTARNRMLPPAGTTTPAGPSRFAVGSEGTARDASNPQRLLPPGQTLTTEPSEFFQPNRTPPEFRPRSRQIAEVPPPEPPPSPPSREGWGIGQAIREMWGDLRADEWAGETAARQRVDDTFAPTFTRERPEGILPLPSRPEGPPLFPSPRVREPEGIETVRSSARRPPESGPSRIIRPGETEFLVDPPRIVRPSEARAGRVSNEAGTINPEVMRALARTGAGAVAGGAADAAYGDDRSPLEGAFFGAALAAGGPSLVRAIRSSPTAVNRQVDEAVRPRRATTTPFAGDVDPDDFANIQSFNLSPDGEARLRAAVEATVRENNIAPKRRVSWEETSKEADRLAKSIGLDPSVLDKGKLRASRLSGPQMLAIRDVVNGNIRDIEVMTRQMASGLDGSGVPLTREAADAIELRLSNMEADNERLLNSFIRSRTQTGRDLNNLRILANATLDPAMWAVKASRVAGGPIDAATQAQIRRLSNAGDREGLASFVMGLRKSGNLEQLTTLWKAGLLTAPPTHIKNLVGNTTMAAMEEAKNVPAFLFDRLLSKVTGVETKAAPSLGHLARMGEGAKKGLKEADEIMGLKEAREALARGEGAREAIRRLGERIRKADLNESDMRKMDLRQVNFDNWFADVYTKGIFKSLGAADRIFRGAAFAGSIDEQARVIARAEGLRAAKFDARVREIISQPSDEMVLRAIADAEFATFQNKGALASVLSRAKGAARDKSPALGAALDVTIPFSQTPANIAARVFDYSPLGAIKSMNDVVKVLTKSTGDKSIAEAQKAAVEGLGRAVVGAGPMGALAVGWYLASQGRMTGEFPTEERERNAWELEGKTAMSVKVGDRWYSLQGISPLGQVMAVGAQMQQMANDPEATPVGFAAGTVASVGTSVMELSALQGVEGALSALRDPSRYGPRFVENLAGSAVPAVVGRAARVGDDVQRDTDGPVRRIQSRIPGLRQSLPERINVLGENVQADPGILANMVDPFNTRQASDDPLVQEMARVGAGLPSLDKRSGETEEAYRDRQRLYGQVTKQVLEEVVGTEEYRSLDDPALQKEFIEEVATRVRSRIGTALRAGQQ